MLLSQRSPLRSWMDAVLSLAALLWARGVLAAVPLTLPPSEDPADWAPALVLGGLVIADTAGSPTYVEITAISGIWRLRVKDVEGSLHEVEVTPPRTRVGREDLVWLATSLLHPMGGGAEESSPAAAPAPRPAVARRSPRPAPSKPPPSAPVPLPKVPEEPALVVVASLPPAQVLVVVPHEPALKAIIGEPGLVAPPQTLLLDTPERDRELWLSLGPQVLARPDGSLGPGLELGLGLGWGQDWELGLQVLTQARSSIGGQEARRRFDSLAVDAFLGWRGLAPMTLRLGPGLERLRFHEGEELLSQGLSPLCVGELAVEVTLRWRGQRSALSLEPFVGAELELRSVSYRAGEVALGERSPLGLRAGLSLRLDPRSTHDSVMK